MAGCKLSICGSCDNAECTSNGLACSVFSRRYNIETDTCEEYKAMIYDDEEEEIEM